MAAACSLAARADSTAAVRAPPSNSDSASCGPSDQNRLGALNRLDSSEPRYPAVPDSVSAGKNAAWATPICALAAATRRSAAAISGRRSSSCDGSWAGTTGGWGSVPVAGRLKLAGAWPSSAARAFSSWVRVVSASSNCTWVDLYCDSACATSATEATPACWRLRVSSQLRS